MKFQKLFVNALIPAMAVVLLSGCGSDSDSNGVPSVTGSVFAAPVTGASCTVRNSVGEAVAGPFVTDSDGHYAGSVDDEHLNQILSVECSGGSFVDEATGQTVSSAGVLSAYLAAGELVGGGQVHATPSTTIIHSMVTEHGKTLAQAREAFNTAFGFTPDSSIAPHDATVAPADAVSEPRLLAGVRAAAFSQMANDLGLTPVEQFAMLNGLAADLAHGSLDGVGATGAVLVGDNNVQLPIDAKNRFAQALVNFNGGDRNLSGLKPNQLGGVPFSAVATSANYRVEYSTEMMEKEGKSHFQLSLTDNAGTPVTDVPVSIMPMMYMATATHSSPYLPCVSNNDGTHDCSIYYLMPSKMMDRSMGYWDVKVVIGDMMSGETVHFYPEVMMAMGDTAKTVLKGQADKIAGMPMGDMPADPASRNYILFNDGVMGMGGNYTFDLFIAAKESMMAFPAVSVGDSLNAGSAHELSITTVLVETSLDGTNWDAATSNGAGSWSAALSGVTDGIAVDVYVRLTVNGEQKTSDGQAPAGDGSNDYATFTITAGAAPMMVM